MHDERCSLNALYSDNRLKLGVFGANVSNGCAATTAPGHLEMNWPNSRDIVTLADLAGFEAVVPVARWKGFGGETNFNGTCFETLAWTAGMGAVTNHASIFCTTHVPTIHPIVAAKQCTTVDHLTGGRFALNVVCGWYSQELRMFGLQTMDHDTVMPMPTNGLRSYANYGRTKRSSTTPVNSLRSKRAFTSRSRCNDRTPQL
jgi:FMNH2-dependent dimethyl sulfone monooxygenase